MDNPHWTGDKVASSSSFVDNGTPLLTINDQRTFVQLDWDHRVAVLAASPPPIVFGKVQPGISE